MTGNQSVLVPSRLISDNVLIDSETSCTNIIEESFNEEDCRIILSLLISASGGRDALTWAYSKGCLYSVNTSSFLGKGGNLEAFHQAWIDVWGMDTSLKVCHFLWRVCTCFLCVHF